MLVHCSMMLTYYQLEEHLLAYYRTWKVNLNEYVSGSTSQIERAIIDAHNRNPARGSNILPQVAADFPQRNVSTGQLPVTPPIPPVAPAIVMRRQPPQTSTRSDLSMHTGNKRKADTSLVIQEMGAEVRKRARRKCWKCDEAGCLGATNKEKCTSACSSCGKLDCSGRNSRHPTRPCPGLKEAQRPH